SPLSICRRFDEELTSETIFYDYHSLSESRHGAAWAKSASHEIGRAAGNPFAIVPLVWYDLTLSEQIIRWVELRSRRPEFISRHTTHFEEVHHVESVACGRLRPLDQHRHRARRRGQGQN